MKTVWEGMNDITRRKILTILRTGPMTAGEICSYFQSRGSTISHHLSILREAGLVTAKKSGLVITYTLNADALRGIIEKLNNFLKLAKN